MPPAAPVGCLVLASLFLAGCQSGPDPAATSSLAPHRPTLSEYHQEQRHAYVDRRADELLKTGRFASEDEAEAYAHYEWSQQNHTAQALSGEGTTTWSSADAANARRKAAQEKFQRDLKEIGAGRP